MRRTLTAGKEGQRSVDKWCNAIQSPRWTLLEVKKLRFVPPSCVEAGGGCLAVFSFQLHLGILHHKSAGICQSINTSGCIVFVQWSAI